jgi:hypothetical protein
MSWEGFSRVEMEMLTESIAVPAAISSQILPTPIPLPLPLPKTKHLKLKNPHTFPIFSLTHSNALT